jgi:hypothetical protein
MYLFLIWRVDLMILIGANPLLCPLEVLGPENLDFLGPKALIAISGPKIVLIFQAHPFQLLL